MAQVSKLSSGIYGSHCNPTLPKTHNNHKPFLGSLLFGSKLKKGSENSLCLSYARVVKNHSAPLRVSASVATAEKPSMSPEIVLQPIKEISGIVKLPGSKSLSNRILLLAALSEGTTVLDNLLNSDDVHYMLGALRTLGLHVEEDSENKRAVVEGSGGLFPVGKESRDEVHLFLGNAGTAMRPLTAAVTAAGGNSRQHARRWNLFAGSMDKTLEYLRRDERDVLDKSGPKIIRHKPITALLSPTELDPYIPLHAGFRRLGLYRNSKLL